MNARELCPRGLTILLVCLIPACASDSPGVDTPLAEYRERMLSKAEADARSAPPSAENALAANRRRSMVYPVAAQSTLPARESLMTQPAATTQPTIEELLSEMADPVDAERMLAKRIEIVTNEQGSMRDDRVINNFKRVVEAARRYLKKLELPLQKRLPLREALEMALQNNYSIRTEAFNPAIATAQTVEAEAAFDSVFFLTGSYSNRDRQTVTADVFDRGDTRSYSTGFRKLLPTGMTVSTSLGQGRNYTDIEKAAGVWNPSTTSTFINTLRQPLLRGFGLDVNRAQIRLSQLETEISNETFEQRVRETMLQVETLYWQLSQARRIVLILSESVAQNEITYQNLELRQQKDISPVELQTSLAEWKNNEVRLLEAIKNVRDAEDALVNVLNDETLKLAGNTEIVPTEVLVATPMAIDQFAEVRRGLDERAEIRAAKKRIEQSRTTTGVAKANLLPQLDLAFQYEVSGTGATNDNSLDALGSNRYTSYTVSVEFSYALGNRAAESRLQQAHLRESQAIVALHQITDVVVLQINNAVRALGVRFEQIPAQYDAVRAARKSLRAFQARSPRVDPPFLDSELRQIQSLAQSRQTLLAVLIQYNIGIVELENAKGTLLDYNNIVLTDANKRR